MFLPVVSPRPEILFAVTSYTGNGGTQSIVTGQNQAAGGLVWGKGVDTTYNHALFDTNRGAYRMLRSDTTIGEDFEGGSLTSFNSNGFSLAGQAYMNENTASQIAFSWLEQAGYMDVVTYTGNASNRTISHNLATVAPSLMIIKGRSVAENWIIYHASLGNTSYAVLNSTSAALTSQPTIWNNTTPTSSVFSLGTASHVNQSGQTYVAYLFAEKAGKSKFGMVSGNGSARTISGFGFRPKLMLYKDVTTSAYGWFMLYEQSGTLYELQANGTDARSTSTIWTFTNDGFTLTGAAQNQSGRTYIYAAWG